MSTQGRYFIITCASHHGIEVWRPTPNIIDDRCNYAKGQLEIGAGGFQHWQFILYFKSRIRLLSVKNYVPNWAHIELARSDACEAYVWKQETRVENTQFEYGIKSIKRNTNDWDAIKTDAMNGNFDQIPSDVLVRHYASIDRLRKDNQEPEPRDTIKVNVYWGVTGSGKTYQAFEEIKAEEGGWYRKSSTTKWWDGYKQQRNVLLDEFDGKSISITHFLQWFDNYPMSVEIKGSAIPLAATNFWITSNIDPNDWFPDATPEHRRALRRRFTQGQSRIVHFAAAWEEIRHLRELLNLNFDI